MAREKHENPHASHSSPATSSSSSQSAAPSTKPPGTLFLKDMTPCFLAGDQIVNIHAVREDSRGTLPKVAIFHKHESPDLDGLYTSAMYQCLVLAAIDRNEQNEVDKIAMLNLDGGFSESRLEHFVAGLDGFSSRKELIFYPGIAYQDPAENLFTKSCWNEALHLLEPAFRAIHQHTAARSCCVTFDGQVGTFNYDPDYLPSRASPGKVFAVREESLSLMNQVAIEEFNKLIIPIPSPQDVEYFKTAMLSQPTASDVEVEVLELTRYLILQATLLPDVDKQALFREYKTEIQQFSEELLHKEELCLAFVINILSSLPVTITNTHDSSGDRPLTSKEKDTVYKMLNQYGGSSRNVRLFHGLYLSDVRAAHDLASDIKHGKVDNLLALNRRMDGLGQSHKMQALISQIRTVTAVPTDEPTQGSNQENSNYR